MPADTLNPANPAAAHVLQCMEVWGGNQAIDNGVVMPGLDAWVFSRPYRAECGSSGTSPSVLRESDAGGDIHYVTSCATGRITRMIVADVSGHGAAVADVAAALRRLMRRYSNYLNQQKLVAELNRRFGDLATDLGPGAADAFAGLFATAVVATYWSPTDELTVCNAGHPRPLRFSASSGRWEVLSERTTASSPAPSADSPANLPLGIIEPTRYDQSVFRLRSGDLVFFYTDSLVEVRDGNGRLLGESGLVELASRCDASRPERFIASLIAQIDSWRGSTEFDDDVTALLIRRNALKPRPSLAMGLLAGAQIIRAWLASFLRGSLPASWPELRRETIGGAVVDRLNGRADD